MTLPPNDAAFNALLDNVRTGIVAFVGAGTSLSSGYPTWAQLLDLLRDNADTHDPRGPRKSPQLDEGDLLWTAEEYRRRLRDEDYEAFLKETFAPKPAKNATALRLLAKLPIKDYLTTNYDNLIEQLEETERKIAPASVCWSNQEDVRKFLARLTGARRHDDPRQVVHLHGKWDQPGNVVLTERDYAARYVSSDSTNNILFGVFAIQPIMFIGFSLSDPDLNILLRRAQASLGPGLPRHYAILGLKNWSDESVIRRRLEGKFGVSPVFYPIITRDGRDLHEGLDILLRRLVDALTPGVPAVTTNPGSGVVPSEADPSDPHKNAFGGQPEVDGFAIAAIVQDSTARPGWFDIELSVSSKDIGRPLTGKVTYYIHPSFRKPVQTITPIGGEAKLRLRAYGAFTVGVSVEQDGKEVRLELDLSELSGTPSEFRDR